MIENLSKRDDVGGRFWGNLVILPEKSIFNQGNSVSLHLGVLSGAAIASTWSRGGAPRIFCKQCLLDANNLHFQSLECSNWGNGYILMYLPILYISCCPVVFCKKVFLEMSQNSQEKTCARVSFLIRLQASGLFTKNKSLAQVFSCEFCDIPKNNFFYRTLPVASSLCKFIDSWGSDWQLW